MTNIYLSGGFVSDWQEMVMSVFKDHKYFGKVHFFDPSSVKYGSLDWPTVDLYSPLDKLKIDQSDIVFAYLEKDNPTPINIALELGYAIGKGKFTILCNEWTPEHANEAILACQKTSPPDAKATWFKPHYLDMLADWVDVHETDIGIAIQMLKNVVDYEP